MTTDAHVINRHKKIQIVKNDLQKLYDFFDRPEKWTRGANARNGDNVEVPLESNEAISFCLIGSKNKLFAFDPHKKNLISQILVFFGSEKYQEKDIPCLNDSELENFDDLKEFLQYCIDHVDDLPADILFSFPGAEVQNEIRS